MSDLSDFQRVVHEPAMERAAATAAHLWRAQAWYRDHVTAEGIYDEAMWGDPFAISPQLREALSPASREEGNG